MNDDLAVGKRRAHRGLDLIADLLRLDNRLTGRHRDNSLGEVVTTGDSRTRSRRSSIPSPSRSIAAYARACASAGVVSINTCAFSKIRRADAEKMTPATISAAIASP